MEALVTVVVIVTVIVLGMFLIHRLNSQHSDGMSAFHYGRTGLPVPGPASPAPHKTRGRARIRRRSRKGTG
ncbi:hypothetical protein [Streptomyces lincolnensis]|uniref:hypothetical protein n=1 Tax=Streptomyces lincolnensis TaxID=1915 RepID=UPI0037CDD3D6